MFLLDKLKARWQAWRAASEAKSFKASQLQAEAFDPKNRGARPVPLAKIVGSVGRYHDFDRHFRLKHHLTNDRLDRLKNLLRGGVTLPPVKLYQIKDEFYVLDGNHRVAAAKELGEEEIEAQIVEFIPAPTTPANLIYREKAEFLEQTGLHDTEITLTEVGQYHNLLAQIQRHQHTLAHSQDAPPTVACAARDWYQTIYQPLVTLIRRGRLLDAFPNRTPADLYAYISTHRWDKRQPLTYNRELDDLIPHDMEEFRQKMAAKQEMEYPEMQREITFFVLMNLEARREERVIEKVFALDEVREIHSVHGNVDVIVKIVLKRDLLTSDAETISCFVNNRIRLLPGVINTQTLIPGLSRVKAA